MGVAVDDLVVDWKSMRGHVKHETLMMLSAASAASVIAVVCPRRGSIP